MQEMVKSVVRKYGVITSLVNNASTRIVPQEFGLLQWEDIQVHLDTHVKGAFNCIRAVLDGFIKNGYGNSHPKLIQKTLDELKMIIDYRSAVSIMDNSPINKDFVAEELSEMRQLFSRSIALVKTLEKGTTLTEADITLKKPGSGIPASQIGRVIGQSLLRRVESNRLLRWEDVSENQ